MIGLELLLVELNMQHKDLAEKLGSIDPQNINNWIKGKRKIPKKYLPILSNIFDVEESFLGKELSKLEQLEIKSKKLADDIKELQNQGIDCNSALENLKIFR